MLTLSMKRIALITLVALAAGCAATSGTTITPEQVAAIQRGKTTKEDIRKRFGEPYSVSASSSGDVWTYYQATAATPLNMFSGGGSYQQVMIMFSGNRVREVQHVSTRGN
jgi:outer membrane protein assembly factor BamE (lipoprotein component of BamABCDE complex)